MIRDNAQLEMDIVVIAAAIQAFLSEFETVGSKLVKDNPWRRALCWRTFPSRWRGKSISAWRDASRRELVGLRDVMFK